MKKLMPSYDPNAPAPGESMQQNNLDTISKAPMLLHNRQNPLLNQAAIIYIAYQKILLIFALE